MYNFRKYSRTNSHSIPRNSLKFSLSSSTRMWYGGLAGGQGKTFIPFPKITQKSSYEYK